MANTGLRADSAHANPANSVDTSDLENAICDMEVAIALTAAIDGFIEQARAWAPENELASEAKNALVLLGQLSDRLQVADERLQTALRKITAARVA